MSAYRTPGIGATVSCQRCGSTVKRVETEYAADGSLRCRRCLHADGGADPTAEWTLRRGFVTGLSWALGGALSTVLGLLWTGAGAATWATCAVGLVVGLGIVVHQLGSGRGRFQYGLLLGALGAGVLLTALVFWAVSASSLR